MRWLVTVVTRYMPLGCEQRPLRKAFRPGDVCGSMQRGWHAAASDDVRKSIDLM
jgi:hypothetical protein